MNRFNRLPFALAIALALGLSIASGSASAASGSDTPSAAATSEVIRSMQVDHVEIGVDDMETMIAWYSRVLGFRVEKRWTVDELPGVELAYLLHPSGWRVELASGISGPRTPRAADFGNAFQMRGYQHICFRVSSVDEAMAEMTRLGVPTFFPPTDFPVGAERRIAFVQDPEGNVIEFAGPLVGNRPTAPERQP